MDAACVPREKNIFCDKNSCPWSTAWCTDAWESCSRVKHSGKVLAIIKEIIPFCGSSRLNLKPYVTCLSPVGAGKKQHSKHFFHPTRLVVVMRNRQSSNNTSKKSVIKRQSWVGAEGSCASKRSQGRRSRKMVNESATYFFQHDTNLWRKIVETELEVGCGVVWLEKSWISRFAAFLTRALDTLGQIKLNRGWSDPWRCGYMYVVGLPPPPPARPVFSRWYEAERDYYNVSIHKIQSSEGFSIAEQSNFIISPLQLFSAFLRSRLALPKNLKRSFGNMNPN